MPEPIPARPRRQDGDPHLTPSTWIPLGVAATLILSVSGGVVWLNAMLGDLDHKIDIAVREISQLNNELLQARERRISRYEFREWAKLLQAQNPNLIVPIPDGILK